MPPDCNPKTWMKSSTSWRPASLPTSTTAGWKDQITYLVDGLGAKHTERQLDDLIAEHANQTEEGE